MTTLAFVTDFFRLISTTIMEFYITDTEIIHDYIVDCGECSQDMDKEFQEVKTREAIFDLGATVPEEVRNIYSILKYIIDNNIMYPIV